MPERKLIDLATFRAEARAGKKPDAAVFRLSVGETTEVAPRTIRFCFSDGAVDRAGDTINPEGWDTASFKQNPVALWAHNSYDPPIGRASGLDVENQRLMGNIEFAAAGIYPFAETIYRLVLNKFIRACSVGFLPLEYAFVEDRDRGFGMDFKRQELLEISVVPVPCNANALVEARAFGIDVAPLSQWAERLLDEGGSVLIPRKILEATFKAAKSPHSLRQKYLTRAPKAETADWKVGASHDLPIDDAEGWDGDAAKASIFAHAGGDDFDPAVARKGFLLYDAAAPKLKGSYKEPFAHVVDGTMKAVKGGIRAAASRLPSTDVPQAAKDEARKVIDHYEEKMKIHVPGARRRDGMSETDPSAGGGTVACCGRAADEECGMKDPEECAIHASSHGDDEDDSKNLLAGLLRELRKLNARGRRRGDKGDGADDHPDDGDGDDDEPQHEAMRSALIHTKAAGSMRDLADEHHDKAAKCLGKAMDAMADPEAEKSTEATHDLIRAAAGHMKDAEGYSKEAATHHRKAEGAIQEALDHLQNPESEGGKAAALKRVAELAARHAD